MGRHPGYGFLAVGLVLGLAWLAGTGRADGTAKKDSGTPADLQTLWADLAASDETVATRAALALALRSREAVAWMKEHLRPIKTDPAAVAKLIERLDSESFEEREQATVDLESLGKYIRKDLEKLVAGKGSAEARRRGKELLERITAEDPPPPPPAKGAGGVAVGGRGVSITNMNGKVTIMIDGKVVDLEPKIITPPGPPRGWLRAQRAIAVLEHLASPEAEAVLRAMADGEREAPPTKAARDALHRLHK
jgi:hypothetical protein